MIGDQSDRSAVKVVARCFDDHGEGAGRRGRYVFVAALDLQLAGVRYTHVHLFTPMVLNNGLTVQGVSAHTHTHRQPSGMMVCMSPSERCLRCETCFC